MGSANARRVLIDIEVIVKMRDACPLDIDRIINDKFMPK
jgi:hypothetical protein